MFAGWEEFTPTNVLVKALVQGFGGASPASPAATLDNISPEALEQMQRSAMAGIAAKADPRWLPIQRGVDKELAKLTPTFDMDELKARAEQSMQRRVKGA